MYHYAISLIIDVLYNLYSYIKQDFRYINIDDKRAYEILYNIFYYSVTGSTFTTITPLKDARLTGLVDVTKKFLKIIFELYDRYVASLTNIASGIYDVALSYFKSNKKYILFCDGMSIIEAFYIAYKARSINFIGAVINPGGVTETYKFIIRPHKYLAGSSRLEEIISQIARETNAKYLIFRDYDDTIHRIENSEGLDPQVIIDEIYNITSRLEAKLDLLRKEGATIMLISDHGYDAIPLISGKFKLQHKWDQHALSIIAPILILN